MDKTQKGERGANPQSPSNELLNALDPDDANTAPTPTEAERQRIELLLEKERISNWISRVATRLTEHTEPQELDDAVDAIYLAIARLPKGEEGSLLRHIENQFGRLAPSYFGLEKKIEAVRNHLLKIEAETQQTLSSNRLIVDSLEDFLAHNFPPRGLLLDPWLFEDSLNMIYGARGLGKTHIGLGIAYAVAAGSNFLRWTAAKPTKVVYVDGEMPGATLQERLAIIAQNATAEPPPRFLTIISSQRQAGPMPDLASAFGQSLLDRAIEPDTALIIIDNLSCLLRSGRENEAESWIPFQDWLLEQKRLKRAVVFIHHAGKSGLQRGTSKREDILDEVIGLKALPETEHDGAAFSVNYEKARNLFGSAAESFEARLSTSDDGTQGWQTASLEDSQYAKAIELLSLEEMNQSDIAAELGVNKSTVSRWKRRAKSEGKL